MYQVFDLNEGEILAGDVRLLYVSSARFERDWNGDRHSHECTEISFCIQGRGEFCIRDAVIRKEAEVTFYIGQEALLREGLYLLDETAGAEWGRPTEIGPLIGMVDGCFRSLDQA